MVGFACDETDELMPTPIVFAHRLTRRLAEVRKKKILKYLGPDGKSQVTIEYDGGRPVRIDTVVTSSQHRADVKHAQIERDIIKHVVLPVLPKRLIDRSKPIKFHINPTGSFVKGGPMADTGLNATSSTRT